MRLNRVTSSLLALLSVVAAAACDDSKTAATAPTAPSTTSSSAPSSPGSVVVTGTVLEVGGGPVAEALVTAKCAQRPSDILGQTLTDAVGKFRLSVEPPPNCFVLVVSKEGYENNQVWPNGLSMTVSLQRLRQVTGQVVSVDGGSLSGVEVRTQPASGRSTLSDANGFFVLDGAGRWIRLTKQGYVDRYVELPGGQGAQLGAVGIQPVFTMSGPSTISSQISSADVAYDPGDAGNGDTCNPCKMIVMEVTQDVEIRLQWSGATPLQLWAVDYQRGEMYTTTRLPAGTEVALRVRPSFRLLYVGLYSPTEQPRPLDQPVPFVLTVAPAI